MTIAFRSCNLHWSLQVTSSRGSVDIGSVDLSQVITLQLVFSPVPWVRSVGYTLLVITIRWQTCLYYSQGCLDTWWLRFISFYRGEAPIFVRGYLLLDL